MLRAAEDAEVRCNSIHRAGCALKGALLLIIKVTEILKCAHFMLMSHVIHKGIWASAAQSVMAFD